MKGNSYLVVKIGGRPASLLPRLDALFSDLQELMPAYRPVLVHGGGSELSEYSKKLGIEPKFVDGIRMTSEVEMDLADMVLAGLMNTRLLRRAKLVGLKAVGLSGVDSGLFEAGQIEHAGSEKNRTGSISSVNTGIIEDLCEGGYLPVLSSVAADREGEGLNINADDAAQALAQALQAEALVYISDIPGVLKDGKVIPALDPELIEAEIAFGTIQGGMIPKVRAAVSALKKGVSRVLISDFEKTGDLATLLEGGRGSSISLSALASPAETDRLPQADAPATASKPATPSSTTEPAGTAKPSATSTTSTASTSQQAAGQDRSAEEEMP